MRAVDRRRHPPARDTAPPAPRILTVHNQRALTGWVKCGACGGIKHIANSTRYVCANHRYRGTCTNARGTREPLLLLAAFEAIYDRLAHGPDFRPLFVAAFGAELERRKTLRHSEAALAGKVDRLVSAIENGVRVESATRRLLQLQDELEQTRAATKSSPLPPLPNESQIRAVLGRAVQSVEASRDVKRTRILFQHLLGEIVPPGTRLGGLTATLREEGWAEYWWMVQAER